MGIHVIGPPRLDGPPPALTSPAPLSLESKPDKTDKGCCGCGCGGSLLALLLPIAGPPHPCPAPPLPACTPLLAMLRPPLAI